MKKINLIIISLGLGFTINLGIGYSLIIPVLIYYLKKDIKNVFYIFPTLTFAVILSNTSNLISIIILDLLVIFLVLLLQSFNKIKKVRTIFDILIVILLNILSYLLLDNTYFNINNLFYILVSIIIFLFLTIEDFLYLNNYIKNPTLYPEHLIVIMSVLGSYKFNLFIIPIGLITSAYFSMFYAKKFKNINSLILMFIVFLISFLGFGYLESLLILLMGCLFFLDYNYLFFIINLLLIIFNLTSDVFKDIYLYTLMITSIVFETLWLIFYKEKTINKMNNDYYHLITDNSVALEYNVFSSFLDFFTTTFKSKKKYSEQMTKALTCITERHCNLCRKQNECFKNNKTDIVYNFKHLIEKKEVDQQFKKNCTSIQGITQTAESLSNQMIKEKDSTNIILLAVLNEIKIILNKYQEEINSKKIIKRSIIKNFHNKLYDSTFDIKEIKYIKLFEDDFLIKIFLNKTNKNIINELSIFIENSFKLKCQIEQLISEDEITLTIIPKHKIHIKYGYGSLSSSQTELCGDNHLIKSYQNGHFLAAISDGMGKGFLAFEDSRRVLEALDSLCYCSTSISTNIEILNLLYILQGYTERYSTLDAIDINRSNMTADIFKLGASNTYIFHDDLTYTKIENSSLPLGIEEEIIHTEIKLKDNDLILFSSDGIFENVLDEQKLLDLIKNIKDEIPQKIAYAILEYTLSSKRKVKDDMSIIILKIEAVK